MVANLYGAAAALVAALMVPACAHASPDVPATLDVPATIEDVRVALNGMAPEDIRSKSPRLDALMGRMFPAAAEGLPCASPGPWLSSMSMCEWHAPGAQADNLPDLFVSLSSAGLDSVVLWGNEPLRVPTWACEIVEGMRQATVCLPRSVAAARRADLVREWTVTLREITRPGNEQSDAQH
jgi:hypothetical protein